MIALAAFIITLYIYYVFMYKRCNRYLNKIPGPSNIPFCGCSLIFCSTSEILSKLLEYYEKYGSPFKIRIGPLKHYIVFADAKSAESILSSAKYIDKSDDYKKFQPWLSTGLLTSSGEKWRTRRKLLTHSFHFSILEGFVDVFNRAGDILLGKLKVNTGQILDILPYISLCSLDIICESAMGVTINAQNQPDMLYVRSVKKMSQIILERTIHPLKRWDFIYRFTKACSDEQDCLKVLHGFTRKVIEIRRKALLTVAEEEFGLSKRKAFLDLLLQIKQENGEDLLTNDDVQEEVDTFMFEGHDTVTSAISLALHCLANNENVQNKLREELMNNFQEKFSKITYQDLKKLTYLELVIKETLRLYPSVPFFSRSLNEDAILGEVKLPKDCTIIINPHIIHRDPKLYTDPEKFDPSRFKNTSNLSPYAYIPFSAGSRNCIGQKFAVLVMKTLLAKIVMSYNIKPTTPVHEPIIAAEVVGKPANGVKIILEELKPLVYT